MFEVYLLKIYKEIIPITCIKFMLICSKLINFVSFQSNQSAKLSNVEDTTQ